MFNPTLFFLTTTFTTMSTTSTSRTNFKKEKASSASFALTTKKRSVIHKLTSFITIYSDLKNMCKLVLIYINLKNSVKN